MLLGLRPRETGDLRLTGAMDPGTVDTLDVLGEQLGFFENVGQGGFIPQVIV